MNKIQVANLIIGSTPFEHDGGETYFVYIDHKEFNTPKDDSKIYDKYSIRKAKRVRKWFGISDLKIYELGTILYTKRKQLDGKWKIESVKMTGHGLPRDFYILKANLEDYFGFQIELDFDGNYAWEK